MHLRRWQLRRDDPEIMTISALRTAIVTTVLGMLGLQVRARPTELPEDADAEALREAVVQVWTAIVDELDDELDPANRESNVVSSPAVLAGIGVTRGAIAS